MCRDWPDPAHLSVALSSEPWGAGEDREVFRCGGWVFKRERREHEDSSGTNSAEHLNSVGARRQSLPDYLNVPRTALLSWCGQEILASEFVEGVRMVECDRIYELNCTVHHAGGCLSAEQMIEIRDLTGLYDFAEGNVIRNERGLHLVDMTLCAVDQPLDFEGQV